MLSVPVPSAGSGVLNFPKIYRSTFNRPSDTTAAKEELYYLHKLKLHRKQSVRKIANIVMYIKSLTVNGELIIRCNYKTEFIGMIISLYSIFDT